MPAKPNGKRNGNGRGKNAKKPATKGGKKTPAKQVRKQVGLRDDLKPFQWKPGQSGNPKGRKPGPTFTTLAKQLLAQPVCGKDGQPITRPDGSTITKLEALVERVIMRAIKGSSTDLTELLARIDPKPKQGSADAAIDIRLGIGPDREVDPYDPPLGVNRLRELPRGGNG